MKKILIIEDDLDTLDVLQVYFLDLGYEVVTYDDKHSIKGVIINRPDIAILDNKLQNGFGHDLCREIKSNPLTSHIPVILISGYHDLKQLAENSGADAFIAKPFDLDVLADRVGQLTGQ